MKLAWLTMGEAKVSEALYHDPVSPSMLDPVHNSLTQQCKPCSAVHHALDQLHPGHMALDLPVVEGER